MKRKHTSLAPTVKRIANSPLFLAVFVLAVLACCFTMLEYSSIFFHSHLFAHLTQMSPTYILLNLLTLGVLWAVIFMLVNRVWLSSLLTVWCCASVAMISHYVIMFHGMPLSFLVLRNARTALSVLSNYSISVDHCVLVELCAVILLTVFSLLMRFLELPTHSLARRCIRSGILAVLSCLVIWKGYFSAVPIKPLHTIGWLWSEAYHQYGFAACTLESFVQTIHPVNEPEGYSADRVRQIDIQWSAAVASQSQPDMILILNESFYDLRQIMDLHTDVPFLYNIDHLENLLSGYAIVPGAGGGTNSSEYELLTSNSLELMPGITPFNTLDLKNANSVVSHLKKLGYMTTGSHAKEAENYSRSIAYPALGFHHSYFLKDFIDAVHYHNRWFETDESVYKNLIRWYESDPVSMPRFHYMLTIQNHGGYDMNSSEYDLVHTLDDYGDNTNLINEYLTGIYQSDQAFKNLTDYFSGSERPVIICMVGDHAPSFVTSLVSDTLSEDQRALLARKVPLLIWANYPLEAESLGTISMNYVVPTLLQLSGITLSPYYDYLLQLKEDIPILTSYGSYYDRAGNLYKYSDDDDMGFEEAVDNYFYLEYNNLQKNPEQSLFDPYDHIRYPE